MDRFSTKIILSILLLRFRKSEQVREDFTRKSDSIGRVLLKIPYFAILKRHGSPKSGYWEIVEK